jgi:large subunit ribosomal protein L29
MKAIELREMSDEQLGLTFEETAKNLFRLRMQAQTERLDVPSELRRHRQLIARIKTVQREREIENASAAKASPSEAAASGA